MFVFVGVPADSFAVFLPLESGLPVMEWTEAIYASTYLLVFIAPLAARKQNQLRELAISGLIATATIAVLFFTIPVIAPPRSFTATTALGQFLKWEQAFDTPGAALPSFHVVWAFLAAGLYTSVWPRLRLVWYGWAIAVAVSCVTTGMHAALDVVAGIGLFLAIQRRERIWLWLLRWTERISNSWKEWRFGSVRGINHGFYAGAAAVVGLAMVGWLSPTATLSVLLVITICSLILGDLLAQLIEGSSRLLRPFGYFGALFGAILGVSLAELFLDAPFWELMSAFTVAAPFIQAIGRLRCLVQGCCHGREAPSKAQGICYTHPTSRVMRIAGLSGRPLYPAPLYSILVNLVLGAILLRLWFLSVPLSLICGIYFLLVGFGRFVEESYRGEPQTPLFGRLHIYQWLAITSVIIGALVTCIDSSAASSPASLSWETLVPAVIGGLLATFAMGVDFPNSNKRFARLTS
jgi:membrane-associated phospholipid phosphatase